MENSTLDKKQIIDGFFHNIFDSPKNSRGFLEKVLPDNLKNRLVYIKDENTKKQNKEIHERR
ncbi:MAG: hypothetical protein MUF15_12105 [Acidobacteria bacterium]|jgi:hypothetical protein|nr:hypothetical protein [Acidobacteriota bacterium]